MENSLNNKMEAPQDIYHMRYEYPYTELYFSDIEGLIPSNVLQESLETYSMISNYIREIYTNRCVNVYALLFDKFKETYVDSRVDGRMDGDEYKIIIKSSIDEDYIFLYTFTKKDVWYSYQLVILEFKDGQLKPHRCKESVYDPERAIFNRAVDIHNNVPSF